MQARRRRTANPDEQRRPANTLRAPRWRRAGIEPRKKRAPNAAILSSSRAFHRIAQRRDAHPTAVRLGTAVLSDAALDR